MPLALKWLLLAGSSTLVTAFQGLNFLSIGLPIWSRYRLGPASGIVSYAGVALGLAAGYFAFQNEFSNLGLAINIPLFVGLSAYLFPWPAVLPERTLYRVLMATAVSCLLLYPVGIWLFQQDSLQKWFQLILENGGLAGLGIEAEANREILLNSLTYSIQVLKSYYVPMVFVLFLLVTALAQRLSLPPQRWPLLARFYLPSPMIYGYILGLLALSWSYVRPAQQEIQLWESLLSNLGTNFILLYSLVGLGILYALAHQKAGRLGAGILNVLISLGMILTLNAGLWQYIQPGLVVVSAFGASETWVHYRAMINLNKKESS